jgi:hypothetical protein
MASTYAASDAGSPVTISPALTAVCLFCLVGLLVSVAVIPHLPAEDFAWIIAHLE